MFQKSILALSALSMIAVPAAAEAHRRHGTYHNQTPYTQGYYPQQSYGYAQQQQAYGYDNGYYGRSYGDRQHRCSGTTGTIVGGAGGALLGRSLGRSRDEYGERRGSGTTGTILGAALGALVGRQVGKSTC